VSFSQPEQRRSRRFAIGFAVLVVVLAIAAVAINIFNPFNLARKPVTDAGDSVYSTLSVKTAKGQFSFKVELADDHAERQKGLMFRQEMPADQGMLFIYESDRDIQMWMKNTYISLDMVFIEANGRIHSISERAPTLSEKTISSNGPVRAVLELNAGKAGEIGLKPGDVVVHAALKTLQ
jgi:uncharacterized protein